MPILRWLAWVTFMFLAMAAGTAIYLTDVTLRLSYWWRER
jgi:hypothetical protein